MSDVYGTPSFIAGEIPLTTARDRSSDLPALTLQFAANYAGVFGLSDARAQLRYQATETDQLGLPHVAYQQVVNDVPVFGAGLTAHFNAEGTALLALTNAVVPDLADVTTQPQIDAAAALTAARLAMPSGTIGSEPQLFVYPLPSPRLAWVVVLADLSIPARNRYVIDALNGQIITVTELLTEGRNRQTYNAQNSTSWPVTPVRTEFTPATGDPDIDNAHAFAGSTYDYYASVHGRDSYDGRGAIIRSIANYGSNYQNAFWDGQQMVYGDGFAVLDVVAHELTHAVTEHEAALEYRWQSGAINESMSDIFGAMVDRNDWLIGEDLPEASLGGLDAIRDMADPARLGQPGHASEWVETCSDNEGVHTNSGVINKAFYNVARVSAIGKQGAEQMFYYALVNVLSSGSGVNDLRSAVIYAASRLYPNNTVVADGVRSGFTAAGIDGYWSPPSNDCSCAVTTAVSDPSIFSDEIEMLSAAATIYRVRDQLLVGPAGLHYRNLYEEYTGRISSMLLRDGDLRHQGGRVLRQIVPGLQALVDGNGSDEVVTSQSVDSLLTFIDDVRENARANGDRNLVRTIDRERARVDWDALVGKTYDEAWLYLESLPSPYDLRIPLSSR